jgi:hypothetical protein
MKQDSLRGWRAFALVFYLAVAVIELLEVIGEALGFAELNAFAEFGGITPEQEAQRLGSLILLSTGVWLSAAITAYSIHRNKAWSVRAGTITGFMLVLYGMYQILSGLFILNANQFSAIATGTIFGLAGLFSVWLVRQMTDSK